MNNFDIYRNMKLELDSCKKRLDLISKYKEQCQKEEKQLQEMIAYQEKILLKIEMNLNELEGVKNLLYREIVVHGHNVSKAIETVAIETGKDISTLWKNYYPDVKKKIASLNLLTSDSEKKYQIDKEEKIMQEIELIDKRTESQKHFLQENGDIIAKVYDEDIHFVKNGVYEEIDNTLVSRDGYYVNKNNAYKVWFGHDPKTDLMQMETNDYFINIKLKSTSDFTLDYKKGSSKLSANICYHDILKNIDIDYKVLPSKVKESIILKDKDVNLNELTFVINTNLELEQGNKGIYAKSNGEIIFNMEVPYMMDANGIVNQGISYCLELVENEYILKLIIDKEWLLMDTTLYPIVIDPTIINSGQTNSVYDTYIYPGDTSVDKNSKEYLKVGVEKINGMNITNRTLLKFTLPVIGTGSQVIAAELTLRGYPDTTNTHQKALLNIHRMTEDWTETNATWDATNNKYDERVEGILQSTRSYYYDAEGNIVLFMSGTDLTNLVKKWYSDTPNYGILIKENKEIYTNDAIPIFFSKNNTVSGENPKPILSITYRNQNGLEGYMNYQSQVFEQGRVYQNNYNGNLTAVFDVGSTVGGKLPANLKLIYNTNDVVLAQNIGYGIGYRLNLAQTIKEKTIDNIVYLEYVDEDGTIHYFLNQKTKYDDNNGFITTTYENTFFDEDGLDLIIERTSSNYTLKNKNNNKRKFAITNGIGYLTEIIDVSGNKNTIFYDTNHKITKVVDANNAEINVTYADSKISVISSDQTVILNFDDSCLSSIISAFGTTLFAHNENNLISSITDTTGKKITYEYYSESPYRIKKLSEYGIHNTLGNYYIISYGYNATTIIDGKDKARTITFNDYGNPVSISSLKNHNDITNAYGIKLDYGETVNGVTTTTNKLLSNQIPLKYVRNYLRHSSFENMESDFNASGESHAASSADCSYSGDRSLKVQRGMWDVEGAYKVISLPKGKYYTFSAYVKPLYQAMYIQLHYNDVNGNMVSEFSEAISPEDKYSSTGVFERYYVTIFYPEDAVSDLCISFVEGDLYYIDDVQLEEGEVANNYNMLENSGFENGTTGWTLNATDENGVDVSNDVFEVVNVNTTSKSLRVKMNPSNNSSFSQSFSIKGKAGDSYTISFWYKNEGFIGFETMGVGTYNNVSFHFNPLEEQETDVMMTKTFNPNEKEWQYFSETFVAPWNFDALEVNFWQSLNANNLYVTNLNLFQDVRSVTYDYDEKGNIIQSKNLNDESSQFNYDKNNQLIGLINPRGQNFTIEYDNVVTDRIQRGVSETGISNEIEYDLFGNPITTRIINRCQMGNDIVETYKIRLKGTNQCLRLINDELSILNDVCGHDKWTLEKVTSNNIDYFRIKHSIILNKYLTVLNNSLALTTVQGDNSLFKFIKKDNGSYLIQNKTTNNYLKLNNNELIITSLVENDEKFEFYLEAITDTVFIENNAEYTSDGKYIKSTTDTNLNKNVYDIAPLTGLTNSITNAKEQTTYYTYNDKRQLTAIINQDRSIDYEYNNQNMLSTITQNGRIYHLNYDEFLNTANIKIGDTIPLITNNYEENNGNLLSSTYGNNDTVSYEYDDFNRVTRVVKMNDDYQYYYGNNGDLLKIKSNNDVINYTYDSAKRLYKYVWNDFKIKYGYDSNDNVISKKYKLNTIEHTIKNTLNDDDDVIEETLDNNIINYTYDSLGRITHKNLNNSFPTNYDYVTNGKRTSLLVKSIDNNNDIYSYRYDKLNNITHIYHNDTLENRYYYDNYNELIREDNYLFNKTTHYTYDDLGNLLYKKEYELHTYNQFKQDTYEYNNLSWKNQLTKFNNDIITYDAIGNPLTIGENISLDWINGRQLNRYVDTNNIVTYKYNKDGIRTSKTVNDIETKYFVEGNDVILALTGNNVIYFIRSNVDGLIGFTYNNDTYYYIKNIQDDITGILDANYNVVVKYIYDAWGNILSITDGENQDISNNSTHIANINPFRYRSYYYDVETNLYYLNSRYYNPIWGRFLNADNFICSNKDIVSNNIYIYCSNNPTNNVDNSGNSSKLFITNFVKQINKKFINVVNNLKNIVSNNKSNNEIPDYTVSLNKVLVKNAAQTTVMKNSLSSTGTLTYFYNQVNSNGDWDYKLAENWNRDIDAPYLGLNGKFMYNGKITTAEDFGNIHYGFIGTYMGFEANTLFIGGGYAKCGITVRIFEPPYYCDDEKDHYSIQRGIDLYNIGL